MFNLEDKKNHLASLKEIPAYLKNSLFIIPLIFCVLSLVYYNQCGAFFACSPDPMYVYLINSANIAEGNFDIGHFDHPGTPVQIVGALIIIITHFFVGRSTIMESVLTNPELYLGVCALVLIAALFISGYYSGKLILKTTGNIGLAFFFQLIPFCSYWALHFSVRLAPEAFIITYLTYYATFLWALAYKKSYLPDSLPGDRSLLFFFSFSTALLITIKVVCLPLLIIPFFFIKKLFPKILYLLITVVFSALLISPIWSKVPLMFNWFTGLATHAGVYGSGKEEVFNVNSFTDNLKDMFCNEIFSTAGYILISISLIAGLVMKKWKDAFYILTLAFWIAITAQILIAAKHYSYHYVIGAQLLVIPAVLAGWAFLLNMKPIKILNYAVFTVCCLWLVYKTTEKGVWYKDGNNEYVSSIRAKKYSNMPKIITTSFEQSCFNESALNFAAAYAGAHFQQGNVVLKKLYPYSYFYFSSRNLIKWWDVDILNDDLFEKNPQILVYFFQKDEAEEKAILNKITKDNKAIIGNIELAEYNNLTGEKYYIIHIDTAKAKPVYSETQTILCDFEKRTDDKSSFVSSDGSFSFGGAERISAEQHFSGNNSAKVSPDNQYIAWTGFAVKPGDVVDVSVNCYYAETPGNILLSAKNGSLYKLSDGIVKDYGNGWKNIHLKIKIPESYSEKELQFSLTNFGKSTCYFDDLNILFLKK